MSGREETEGLDLSITPSHGLQKEKTNVLRPIFHEVGYLCYDSKLLYTAIKLDLLCCWVTNL